MNRKKPVIRLARIVLLLLPGVVGAGELPAILATGERADVPYLPDFSYAGYANGERDIPAASGKLIEVRDHGALPDDGIDDSKALRAALAAAAKVRGPVRVRFAAGRYRISEVLKIERGDIVLQGAGSAEGGTTLYFPRPLAQVDTGSSLDELRKYLRDLDKRQVEPDANIDSIYSEYSWSGGFIWVQKPGTRSAPYLVEFDPPINTLTPIRRGNRGERTIELADSAAVAAGDVVQVHWTNSNGADAALIDEIYADKDIEVGSHHWTFPERPLVRQTTRVIAVDGTTATLSDPLLHAINDDIPATLAEWPHLENVGFEDLHLEFPVAPWFGHHMERGYNGIYLTSAFDSWVSNVRITNADSGILTYNSANLTLRDIVTDGSRPAHYGVHMGNVHNVLAERVVVFNPVRHSLTFNTQSTKCVYKDATVWNFVALDQHAGANHQNLYDNVTLYVTANRDGDGDGDDNDRARVTVFDGSGAGYWQPGHGAFNTTWNLNLIVTGGARHGETVVVEALDEGPSARIVGLHGNRHFELDYRPAPYVERLNARISAAPSLYDFQRMRRKQRHSETAP